jgi:hypothetical protein
MAFTTMTRRGRTTSTMRRSRSPAGTSYRQLGDYDLAAREFTATLGGYGDGYARDQAYCWDQLAAARLDQHDLDQATHAGNRAVDLLSAQVRSPRTAEQVRSLVDKFAPHAGHPGVDDFLARVHLAVRQPRGERRDA